jgi:hypothetical protein
METAEPTVPAEGEMGLRRYSSEAEEEVVV